MRVIVPPLKSQGIKTKLVPWIRDLAPTFKGRWIEPFLGTGVVALNCGCSQAVLGDINPHIIRLYQAIQSGEITPGSVRKYLEREGAILSSSEQEGYAHFRFLRDRFNAEHNPLDLIFLSRAGFNGMMRFNRKGAWNIPFCKKPERFAPAYITKIVNQVEDAAKIIKPEWQFITADFETIIKMAGPDDLIYCDPPYLGRHVDYFSNWTEDDERRLSALLSETPAKFILSTWHHNDYRKNEAIPAYWSQFNVITRDHFYHTGGKLENRRSVVEALVFNFEAKMPEHTKKPDPPPSSMTCLPTSLPTLPSTHRKRVQAQRSRFTLTSMHRVLEKLRRAHVAAAGSRRRTSPDAAPAPDDDYQSPLFLTNKEKRIHDDGLVSVLKQLHDDLDAAVFAAYGWQHLWEAHLEAQTGSLTNFQTNDIHELDCRPEGPDPAIAAWERDVLDAEILERLVALNAQRAEEEKHGIIHWLRPEYQCKQGAAGSLEQGELPMPKGKAPKPGKHGAQSSKPPASSSKPTKQAWPKPLAERIRATEQALHAAGAPVKADDLTQSFARAKAADVQEILDSLVTLGRARRDGDMFSV